MSNRVVVGEKLHRYLLRWTSLTAGLLLTMVTVNLAVDPLDYVDLVEINGFNERKPFATGDRVAKALAIARTSPDVVIGGTSRAKIGIDPSSPFFGGASVYNLGLEETNVFELESVLRFALQHSEPKALLWGLDFFTFTDRRQARSDYFDSPFNGDWFSWVPKYVLSGAVFVRSIKTVMTSITHGGSEFTDRYGFTDKKPGLRIEHRTLFDRILKGNFLVTVQNYAGFRYSEDRLERFRNILDAYADAGARVDLFFSPIHARHLEAIHALGLWGDYERWKRDVVGIVADLNGRHDGAGISLWDFSGYNSVTTEPIPEAGSTAPMRWYWESSHYKKEVGEMVLQRLYGAQGGEGVPDDFGTLMTTDNVDRSLAMERAGRRKYAEQHSHEIEEVARMVKETAPERERRLRLRAD